MPFASFSRFFGSFRRNFRRRDGAAQRRLQRHGSARRVQAIASVNGVVQVADIEATPAEIDVRSNRSMSSSFYFTRSGARSDRLGRDATEVSMSSVRSFRIDPVEVAKKDQKKLRKALERAVRQERKEARKMQKLADKAEKSLSKNNRLALLSAGTASDCSTTSDQDILAEIWARRSPSLDRVSREDLPEVDDDLENTAPMEFLFFAGCPDDKNLRELDVGYRRLRTNPRATRYPVTPSYATSVAIKPTLVSKMPPVFTPRFDVILG